jgi:hypothetical protein
VLGGFKGFGSAVRRSAAATAQRRAESAISELRARRLRNQRIFEFLDEDGDGYIVVDEIAHEAELLRGEGAPLCPPPLLLCIACSRCSRCSLSTTQSRCSPHPLPPLSRDLGAGIIVPAFGLSALFLELSQPVAVGGKVDMAINCDQFELGMALLRVEY